MMGKVTLIITKGVFFFLVAVILIWEISVIVNKTQGNKKWQPMDSVVKLEVISANECGNWSGTGFFVADDLIMTAGHVVEDVDEIWIIWPDGKKHKAVSWYQETEADLGIVYIQTPQIEKTATFDEAKTGETVWALGEPFNAFPVMSKGIISAINMPDSFTGQKNMIIADCAINPGNSGGPLFDKDNNILGVCSWRYNCAQGMSYFVRAEICKLTLDKYYAIQALKEIE